MCKGSMRHRQILDVTIQSCFRPFCILLTSLLFATGCEQEPTPIASEHAEFVGVWEQGKFGEGTTFRYMQISASGYFSFAQIEKNDGISTCSTLDKSPLVSISSTQISISFLWFFTAKYKINKPPTKVENTWRITIDGHELIRTVSRKEGFDYSWSCSGPDLLRKAQI